MKICIAGKNNIAVEALRYLMRNIKLTKENIYVIPNRSDNGKDYWQKSLLKFASRNRLRIARLEDVYQINNLYFISLEFDRIIDTTKFKSSRLYNYHFSLLPKYKGMHTSIFPLLNGDTESGVTLHAIDQGIDTGPIIDRIKFSIRLNDTCRDLYFKYLKYGAILFKRTIKKLLYGSALAKKQPVIGSTYFPKDSIDYKSIHIDFNRTSFQIHNQIRAYIFEEYQLPKIQGKKIIQSCLTSQKIQPNSFSEFSDRFILSGIDGYKIILNKKYGQNILP